MLRLWTLDLTPSAGGVFDSSQQRLQTGVIVIPHSHLTVAALAATIANAGSDVMTFRAGKWIDGCR